MNPPLDISQNKPLLWLMAIACGLCADTCPEVFEMADDDGLARVCVDEIPAEVEDTALEARDNCPVEIITVA